MLRIQWKGLGGNTGKAYGDVVVRRVNDDTA